MEKLFENFLFIDKNINVINSKNVLLIGESFFQDPNFFEFLSIKIIDKLLVNWIILVGKNGKVMEDKLDNFIEDRASLNEKYLDIITSYYDLNNNTNLDDIIYEFLELTQIVLGKTGKISFLSEHDYYEKMILEKLYIYLK